MLAVDLERELRAGVGLGLARRRLAGIVEAHEHGGVGAAVEEGQHDHALLAHGSLELGAIDGSEHRGRALGSAVEADARATVGVEPDDSAEARLQACRDRRLTRAGV